MTGVLVTWDENEIQAIDDDNFEETVVDVVENFFDAVDGYSEITVEWQTPTRNHDCIYKVTREPLVHLDRSRCFIDIVGEQRGGEYQIDLKPSGFDIKMKSTGQTEELNYLRLRDSGLAIDPENQEVFLKSIPTKVKKRVVERIK
jgi:hypothetical protein